MTFRLLVGLLALAATPALSQQSQRDIAREKVLDRAMAEHRVYLTCHALDPDMSELIHDGWAVLVRDTAEFLQAEGARPANLEAFIASADGMSLLPADEVSFAEVRRYCVDNADLLRAYMRFEFTLPVAVFEGGRR